MTSLPEDRAQQNWEPHSQTAPSQLTLAKDFVMTECFLIVCLRFEAMASTEAGMLVYSTTAANVSELILDDYGPFQGRIHR